MRDKIVCTCNFVPEKEILICLKKGALSAGEVRQFTKAGTTCGRCNTILETIVGKYLKGKAPDQQQRFIFE